MKKRKPALLPQIVLLFIIGKYLVLFVHEVDCSRKFLCLSQFYLTNLNWINRNLKFISSPFEVCTKILKSWQAWTTGFYEICMCAGSNTSWNWLFFLIFTPNRGGWNVRGKMVGQQSYLATSREDMREAHTILASWYTNSLLSRVYSSIDWCLNSK